MKRRANKFQIRWIPIIIGLVLCAAAGFGLAAWQDRNSSKPTRTTSLAEACHGDKAADLKCQQDYYKATYEEKDLEVAFADLRKEYEANTSVRSNCHQLTHAIGRAAAAKHGDVAKAYVKGDEFCWSGYYHGVMEGILQKMGNASVQEKLNTICQSLKDEAAYSFKHYNCAHGLGHGIMLIEGAELFVSLKVCDTLKDSWERESCYGGVFMENIMAHNNPDHDTKYLRNDDPMYPCTAVELQYRNQCYGMQTSHALMVVGRDYGKVFTLCSQIDMLNQATCYQSLGRDASGDSVSDPDKTHAVCMLGPTPAAQENCVIGAVKDFVSYYHNDQQAGVFCGKLEPPLQTTCNQVKTNYYQGF